MSNISAGDLNQQLGVKNGLFLELYSRIHGKLLGPDTISLTLSAGSVLRISGRKVVIVKKTFPEEKVILETQVLP